MILKFTKIYDFNSIIFIYFFSYYLVCILYLVYVLVDSVGSWKKEKQCDDIDIYIFSFLFFPAFFFIIFVYEICFRCPNFVQVTKFFAKQTFFGIHFDCVWVGSDWVEWSWKEVSESLSNGSIWPTYRVERPWLEVEGRALFDTISLNFWKFYRKFMSKLYQATSWFLELVHWGKWFYFKVILLDFGRSILC